jgi:glycosidase
MEKIDLKKLKEAYLKIYKPLGYTKSDFLRLERVIKEAIKNRSDELKIRDQRAHDWYLSEQMIGMTLYVNLFSKNIKSLIDKIPYFQDLGITFIHLMPLLKPRKGNSDGGYAVENYRDINPDLGTLQDFKDLVKKLHENDISVAIDFVINHTAKEHEWAKKAAKGETFYQNMYMMYDTDEIPKKFNETVPEVLPDQYPGNYTYYDSFKKYVYKSFSEFQWDLNFENPYVLEEIISIFFFLANLGIDVIRLDAIPFIWKELGTTCRNLAEVHQFMHIFHLANQIVCPSVVILGEAIVEPHEIFKYFGDDEKPECGLLYNANMMVNFWNALATRDVRTLEIDQMRFVLPKHGAWINYIRCHDDIGWGLNEEALKSFGFDPFSHKQFLINFYNGNFEGSFSKGQNYQFNKNTLDARTNGTLASLSGLEKAIEEHDRFGFEESLKRNDLLNALMFFLPGIPLIYSGDEVGILNDYKHANDPHKTDGRWIHRPFFPWDESAFFEDENTYQGHIFNHIKKLGYTRKSESIMHSSIPLKVMLTRNVHIYAVMKEKDDEKLLGLFNFSENHQIINLIELKTYGVKGFYKDLFQKKSVDMDAKTINMYPYEYLWLKQ